VRPQPTGGAGIRGIYENQLNPRTPPARTAVVYDLEITPNRPDLNSVIGIAREIGAITGNRLKVPEVKIRNSEIKVEDLIAVRIEDPELCPRYTARVIRGVKIGPSPEWLKITLEKVGVRSINNVVDVTNYVMLEVGQPLHAFDYRLNRSRPRRGRRALFPTNRRLTGRA